MKKNKQGNKKQNKQVRSWTSLAKFGNNESTVLRRCTRVITVNSTASNIFNGTISDGTVTLSTEWSGLSPRWAEYRVLRIKTHFADYALPTSTNANYVVFATDRSGIVAAPTSAVDCWARDAAKIYNADNQVPNFPKYAVKASDLEDQEFISTGLSTSRYAIHYFGASNSPSVAVASMFVEYLVEFRGAL